MATRYNQRPTILEGGLFRREWFAETKWRGDPEEMARDCVEITLHGDCAQEQGQANDWTVITTVGRIGRHLFQLGERRGRWLAHDICRNLKEEHDYWSSVARGKVTITEVEKASSGVFVLQQRPVPRMAEYSPHRGRGVSKQDRWSHALAMAEGGELHLQDSPMGYAVEDELVASGAGGAHDDRTDTWAMACERMANRNVAGRGLHVGF